MAITVEYDSFMEWALTTRYADEFDALPSEVQHNLDDIMDGGSYSMSGGDSADDIYINSLMEHTLDELFDADELEQGDIDREMVQERVEYNNGRYLGFEDNTVWAMY